MAAYVPPHLPPAEQAELGRAIAAGDEVAFAKMLRVYGDTIFSQAMAYTKSTVQSEELTQDIFMRDWQKRELFVKRDNFEGWLFTLARNLIYNFLKSNLKKPLPVLLPGDDSVSDALTSDLQTEGRTAFQLLLKGID